MSKGEIIIADTTPTKKSCSKKWASLIKKIYEVDPLLCCESLKIFEPSTITEDVASFRGKSQEPQEWQGILNKWAIVIFINWQHNFCEIGRDS